MSTLEATLPRREVELALSRATEPLRTAVRLRWTVCRDRAERQGLDSEREGTVCQGCRYSIETGCPNTRAWTIEPGSGRVKVNCAPADLVYCKHYDCGCPFCADKG